MTYKELLALLVIVVWALLLRLWRLDQPPAMYFDEVYHVPAATLMSRGDFRTPFVPTQATYDGVNVIDWLHPPLAKYLQALAILTLSQTPMAWRLPSVLISTVTVLLFYFFVRFVGRYFLYRSVRIADERSNRASNLALVASFFLSVSGLFLVQSRIAMNDVFLVFFLLCAAFAYFAHLASKRWMHHQTERFLLLSGVFLGLALATKWTALWIIGLLFAWEFLPLRDFRKLPFLLFCLLVTPIFIYTLSYIPMFRAGASLTDFLNLQRTIALSQLHNPSTHLYSSGPLSWLLNLRPVWYLSLTQNLPAGTVANIYALENPLLTIYSWGALGMAGLFLVRKQVTDANREAVLLLCSLYLAGFAPWLFFMRVAFIYHYLPAIPFLLVLLAYFLLESLAKITDASKRIAWTFNLLFWPLWFFVLFYPHWVAMPVPEGFAKVVYFFIQSWR